MHSVTNPIQACNDIFFRPNGVFKAVGEKNNWSWIPFIIIVMMSMASQYLYVHSIDIDWFANLSIAAQEAMSPAEEEQMRSFFTRKTMMMSQLIGAFFGLIIVNALFAVYLNLATRSDDSHVFGFTDWYGFTWWVSMPYVITTVISVALILFSSDHQISPSVLSPLSIAHLFSLDMSSSWFAFAQALRVELLWAIYLTTVGISQWTSFTTKKAAIIASAPYAVIYSIWLIAALL